MTMLAYFIVTRMNLGCYSTEPAKADADAYTETRLWFLRHTFAPTIAAQSDRDFRVLLLYDAGTPQHYVAQMRAIVQECHIEDRVSCIPTPEPFHATDRGRGSAAVLDVIRGDPCDFVVSHYYDIDDLLCRDFVRSVRDAALRGIRDMGGDGFVVACKRRTFVYDLIGGTLRVGTWPKNLYCIPFVERRGPDMLTCTRRPLHAGHPRKVSCGPSAMLCVCNHDSNVSRNRRLLIGTAERFRSFMPVSDRQAVVARPLFPALANVIACTADQTPKSNVAEWHITYRCDLACTNCNRLCFLEPQTRDMTLEDAKAFVRQAQECGWRPEVRLLGGEPTLHPDFLGFIEIAKELSNGPVGVWSHGCGEHTQRLLDRARDAGAAIRRGTQKPGGGVTHRLCDWWLAPVDFGVAVRPPCRYHTATSQCGISVDADGYTICPCGGAIDGVLQLGVRTKRLADLFDRDFARQQTRALCSHCGFGLGIGSEQIAKSQVIHGALMSPTWQQAVRRIEE